MAQTCVEILIPKNRLRIYKNSGAKRGQDFWQAQVYCERNNRPVKSLKTRDKTEAIALAHEWYIEVKNQQKKTGTTSGKTILSLCKQYVSDYEERGQAGLEGGSDSNVRRTRNTIGKLLPAFCKYQKWEKPCDIDIKRFQLAYPTWRQEEGGKVTGREGDVKLSTIFNELILIRSWSKDMCVNIDKPLMKSEICIPKRIKFVTDENDDANPAFTASDYKKITAAYRRWINKGTTKNWDIRTKKVFYLFFLICTSVGWRCYSEGLQAKWAWILGISDINEKVGEREVNSQQSNLRIRDSKRKRWREGYFINAGYFIQLKDLYKEWNAAGANIALTNENWIFIDPRTGKQVTSSQIYDHYTEIIKPDSCLSREDYTYYSCRSYMITERLKNGANPLVLKNYTGHSEKIMLKHYQGDLDANNKMMATSIRHLNPSSSEATNKTKKIWEC